MRIICITLRSRFYRAVLNLEFFLYDAAAFEVDYVKINGIIMTYLRMFVFCFFLVSVTACGGSGAKELYETAQFEELQNNHKHALQLYEEIIRDFPGSEHAKKSGERIAKIKGN